MTGEPKAQLRCAGCGCAGRMPTIIHAERLRPPEPVLTPQFGWGDPPRTVLLYSSCKGKLQRRRPRRARA
jgi:hypothetical protein